MAKAFVIPDKIRDDLNKLNIEIKDAKEGANWEIKE